jgi:colicin import membrane protein
MLTTSLQRKAVMKCFKNAAILIAACAAFHWAGAQNSTENTVSGALAISSPAASDLRAAEQQERTRIEQEKAAITVDYEAAKADCYQKFQVNSCLAQARSARINRSSSVKRQEILLNDRQRKRRADEQSQSTQAKALARGEDTVAAQPKAPLPAQASASQSLPATAQPKQRSEQQTANQQSAAQAAQAAKLRKNEVANKQTIAVNKAAARKAKQAQAAEAKARYEANLKDAQARRASAAARQQAAKKNLLPLPVPAN